MSIVPQQRIILAKKQEKTPGNEEYPQERIFIHYVQILHIGAERRT